MPEKAPEGTGERKEIAGLGRRGPRPTGMPTAVVCCIATSSRPTSEAKDDCPYAHQYYGAAFVLTGDPG
jgi:hypothetical protein